MECVGLGFVRPSVGLHTLCTHHSGEPVLRAHVTRDGNRQG